MLKELLAGRELLPILEMNDGTPVTAETWEARRLEMRTALEIYSYGHTPAPPERVWGEILRESPEFTNAYAGKVRQERILLSFETEKGVCSFPFVLAVPRNRANPPVLLHLAFRRDLPDRYVPVEEITDAGYCILL